MANGSDPYRAYNFKLDIAGITEGHFTQCSSIGIAITPIEYREGGNNQIVRHIPGHVRYEPITLSYGLTRSRELWDWLMRAVAGNVERKNVSIILLDNSGTNELMRWNLIDAWPSQWRGAPLDALSKEIAIENITLVFDTLERG